MENITYTIVPSPIGDFVAGATSKGCCTFEFADRGGLERIRARLSRRYRVSLTEGTNTHITMMTKQVKEYFEGKRKEFSLTFDLKGTKFEMSVWEALMKIPYGETRAYGELASMLGRPGAARAVGRANGANYIPIIIPCHRVIDANGSLHGYGGGLWRKQWLLEHEGATPKQLFS